MHDSKPDQDLDQEQKYNANESDGNSNLEQAIAQIKDASQGSKAALTQYINVLSKHMTEGTIRIEPKVLASVVLLLNFVGETDGYIDELNKPKRESKDQESRSTSDPFDIFLKELIGKRRSPFN